MDEGFGYKDLSPQLRVIGYQIYCHQEHNHKRQGIKDDENIVVCAKNNWLLTTTDKNLVLRYRDLLHKHKQSVVFTSNNQEKFETWVRAFTKAKAAIERNWRKKPPSWIGRLHPNGYLEVSALMQYTEYQSENVRRKRPA
jgi:hypothetical protein